MNSSSEDWRSLPAIVTQPQTEEKDRVAAIKRAHKARRAARMAKAKPPQSGAAASSSADGADGVSSQNGTSGDALGSQSYGENNGESPPQPLPSAESDTQPAESRSSGTVTTNEESPSEMQLTVPTVRRYRGCRHWKLGCKFEYLEGSDSDLESHLESCPFELMKSYIGRKDHQIEKLEETVSELTSKVDELQQTVQLLVSQNTVIRDPSDDVPPLRRQYSRQLYDTSYRPQDFISSLPDHQIRDYIQSRMQFKKDLIDSRAELMAQGVQHVWSSTAPPMPTTPQLRGSPRARLAIKSPHDSPSSTRSRKFPEDDSSHSRRFPTAREGHSPFSSSMALVPASTPPRSPGHTLPSQSSALVLSSSTRSSHSPLVELPGREDGEFDPSQSSSPRVQSPSSKHAPVSDSNAMVLSDSPTTSSSHSSRGSHSSPSIRAVSISPRGSPVAQSKSLFGSHSHSSSRRSSTQEAPPIRQLALCGDQYVLAATSRGVHVWELSDSSLEWTCQLDSSDSTQRDLDSFAVKSVDLESSHGESIGGLGEGSQKASNGRRLVLTGHIGHFKARVIDGFSLISSTSVDCTGNIRCIESHRSRIFTAAEGQDSITVWSSSTHSSAPFSQRAFSFESRADIRISKEAELEGHTGAVTCIALKKNILFSGSNDQTVRVWDPESLQCIKVLQHPSSVLSICLSSPTHQQTRYPIVARSPLAGSPKTLSSEDSPSGHSHLLEGSPASGPRGATTTSSSEFSSSPLPPSRSLLELLTGRPESPQFPLLPPPVNAHAPSSQPLSRSALDRRNVSHARSRSASDGASESTDSNFGFHVPSATGTMSNFGAPSNSSATGTSSNFGAPYASSPAGSSSNMETSSTSSRSTSCGHDAKYDSSCSQVAGCKRHRRSCSEHATSSSSHDSFASDLSKLSRSSQRRRILEFDHSDDSADPLPLDRLWVGGLSGELRVWDTSTWTLCQEMRGHGARVNVLSSTEEEVIAGYPDGSLKFWDAHKFVHSATVRSPQTQSSMRSLLATIGHVDLSSSVDAKSGHPHSSTAEPDMGASGLSSLSLDASMMPHRSHRLSVICGHSDGTLDLFQRNDDASEVT